MVTKRFIPLENLNLSARVFKYRRTLKQFIGYGLIGIGVATLPLPTGSFILIGIGAMMSMPISIRTQVKNKYTDLKIWGESKLIRWGFR